MPQRPLSGRARSSRVLSASSREILSEERRFAPPRTGNGSPSSDCSRSISSPAPVPARPAARRDDRAPQEAAFDRGHRGRPGDQQRRRSHSPDRCAGYPDQHRAGLPSRCPCWWDTRAADLALRQHGILFIENVGNLVCPAGFDLGEGKACRHPVRDRREPTNPSSTRNAFAAADIMVLSKLDLLPHVDFDASTAIELAKRVNPERSSGWFGHGHRGGLASMSGSSRLRSMLREAVAAQAAHLENRLATVRRPLEFPLTGRLGGHAMHELTSATSLVDLACSMPLSMAPADRPHRPFRLGVLCGIARSLYFCFKPAARGTPCEDADLRNRSRCRSAFIATPASKSRPRVPCTIFAAPTAATRRLRSSRAERWSWSLSN